MSNGPSQQMKFKLKIVVGGFIVLCFLILAIRIVYVALFAQIGGVKYRDKAYNQQLRSENIKANRGTIYDRNMVPIAESATVWQVSLEPNLIKTEEAVEKITNKLHELFPEIDEESIRKKCYKKNKYELIKKHCEKPERDALLNFMSKEKLEGIHLTDNTKRYYPFGDLASHIIGFCGSDNQGLLGLELFYDKDLKGTDGKLISVQNGKGQPMPYNYESYYPAKNGNSVVTSIDVNIQRILQKSLETHCDYRRPLNRAAAIAMDAKTQEILGLAVYPSFDLNKPFELPDISKFPKMEGMTKQEALNAMWRNKPICDVLEPGSVFKMVTGAAVLDEGLMDLTQDFYCTGAVQVGPKRMHCWKRDGSHGHEDFKLAFVNSCNPCFITMGDILGAHRFYKYLELFGITSKTNIDLIGEAIPLVVPENKLGIVELASESFGQTLAVTPLHIMRVLCTILNGGYCSANPHLMTRIVNQNGNTERSYQAANAVQVISKKTADTMKEVLTAVVDGADGNGTNASVAGYKIAGKSGTAQKLHELKHNDPDAKQNYVPSYVGAINIDGESPIVVMVLIDSPTFPATEYYGGMVAAPLFREIVLKIINYLNLPPDRVDELHEKMFKMTPKCEGLSRQEVRDKLFNEDFASFEFIGDGDKILQQMPPCGTKVNKNTKIVLYTQEIHDDDKITVPNVVGLTQSQANNLLTNHKLNLQMSNAHNKVGRAISQNPEPGTTVLKGHVVEVDFIMHDDSD